MKPNCLLHLTGFSPFAVLMIHIGCVKNVYVSWLQRNICEYSLFLYDLFMFLGPTAYLSITSVLM